MEPVIGIFLTFGAALAITGIVLFVKMGVKGSNSIKMFGFEFQLSGSALVIFVLGVVLMLVPVVYSDKILKLLIFSHRTFSRNVDTNPAHNMETTEPKTVSKLPEAPKNVSAVNLTIDQLREMIIKDYEKGLQLDHAKEENIRLKKLLAKETESSVTTEGNNWEELSKLKQENENLKTKLNEFREKLISITKNSHLRAAYLTWDPNSSPDLAGYRIYSSGMLFDEVDKRDTEYLAVVKAGTYAFTMTAFDSNGNESAHSEPYIFVSE